MTDAVARAALILGGRARADAPLGALTTYRVGGPAALLVEDATLEDLDLIARAVAASGLPTLVVGKGSNLLVADAGFPGIAITLGPTLAEVEVEGTVVRAGGAAALPVVARRTARAGLTGFEWAVGVPGSIGGAVRMNAGGHGSDMAAVLATIRVADLLAGEDGAVVRTLAVDELALGYRTSRLARHEVVVEATLLLAAGDRERSEAEISEIVRWRREHQPGGPNAGSVFTNPPGDSAGRLIDTAGLRGHRIGTAAVSEKHANFIQADAGGRAEDVLAVMREVARRVAEVHGVDLHPETHLVGLRWDDEGRS